MTANLSTLRMNRTALALAATVALAPMSSASAVTLEQPPVLRAADILLPELRQGSEHEVQSAVRSDGLMNWYTVNSRFGEFTATSTEALRLRVREIYAIAEMRKISRSDAFLSAAAKSAEGVVQGVANVATDPLGSVSGALSGVGKLFKRTGETLSGNTPSTNNEDSLAESLIGVSEKKREYAKAYNVDVYSSNALLQGELDRLAQVGAGGSLGIGVSVGAVSGGVLTATQTTQYMNKIDVAKSPADIKIENREKLRKMEVSEDIIDLLMGNTEISPTRQSIIVAALESMDGVGNRAAYVKQIVTSADEDVTLFRQVQAEMFAAYHREGQDVTAFEQLGAAIGARRASGSYVFMWPVDHLSWTSDVQAFAAAVAAGIGQVVGKAPRSLWLSGTASQVAVEQLTKLGWAVELNAVQRLKLR